MHEILRPKILLFFAIAIISALFTADKSYASQEKVHDASIISMKYVNQFFFSVTSYCQHLYHEIKDWFVSCFVKSDSVKIQIRGKKIKEKDLIDNKFYRTCTVKENNENRHLCPVGDMECVNNQDYFKNAYFDGVLVPDNYGSDKIDEYDTKYCGYIQAINKIRDQNSLETNSLASDLLTSDERGNSLDKIKDYYDGQQYGL